MVVIVPPTGSCEKRKVMMSGELVKPEVWEKVQAGAWGGIDRRSHNDKSLKKLEGD